MSVLLQSLAGPEWSHVVKTLLHSLWQGALIAVALALAMRRIGNPHWRYRFSLLALAAIPVVGIITWAALNASNRPLPIVAPLPISAEAAPQVTPGQYPQTKVVLSANHSAVPPPAQWTAWLALLWIVGAGGMLGRASIKLAGAEQLRRSCRPLENAQVTQLLAEARRIIGLTRKIRIAVTDKLTSPAVVGVVVPTLVLPLSLVSALTPEQIRFILLHELAHIRRGDYFANLFQLFVEAALFFNPAVWWISHQLRREREACCDALAIELSGAPADYALTLVHVAQRALEPAPEVAPAFGGKREPSSLADRVQRLLVPGYRPSLRLTWRAMATAFALGAVLLVLSAEGTRVAVAQITKPQPKVGKANSNDTINATVSNGPAAMAEIADRFAIDDQVTVKFSGTINSIPRHEERIKRDGSITLPLIGAVMAADKTPVELQKEIHDRYVPAYYKRLTVIVTGEEGVSFVGGRVPVRQVYRGATRPANAIQSAGDFDQYADRRAIGLTLSERAWLESGSKFATDLHFPSNGLSKTNPPPIEISGSTLLSNVEYNISAEDTKGSTTPLQQVETLPSDNTFALSNHFTKQFNLGEPKSSGSMGPRMPAQVKFIRSPDLDRITHKLHDMRFQFVVCSNKPLGELFRELSEQSEALDKDGVGFMFSVIPIRLRTIPATIDPPLTNASLSEILAAIQGAPQLRLNGVNTNGLVTLQTIASFAQNYPKNKGEFETGQRQPQGNFSPQTNSEISRPALAQSSENKLPPRPSDLARPAILNSDWQLITGQNQLYRQRFYQGTNDLGMYYWTAAATNQPQLSQPITSSPTEISSNRFPAMSNLPWVGKLFTSPQTLKDLPPVEISGLNEHSRVNFDTDTRCLYATNGATAKLRDMTIRADSIEFNQLSGKLIASGNVRVERQGDTNETTRIELNIHSNQPPALFPMIFTNEKKRVILNKLNQIRLERVAFDAIPLSNVVLAISAEAQRLDPEGRGVKIIINSNVNSPEDGRPVDVSDAKVTISPPLANVRLMDALDAILKGVDQPLKLTIEEYGAAISLKQYDEPSPLLMREFKVKPILFANWLAENGFPITEPSGTTDSTRIAESIRGFLAKAGIALDPMLGKSIYYSDKKGNLLIRATKEELDGVEKLVIQINRPELKINVKTHLFEASFIELEAFLPDLVATGDQPWAGILSKPQLSQVWRCIQTGKSVSLLSDGEVTTSSGRRAQLQTVEIKTIVTGINPNALVPPGISTNTESLFIATNLSFGPAIDIVPAITPDGYSVAMTVIPRVTEFLGYDGIEHPTNTVAVYVNGKNEKTTVPLPRLRTQQMTNDAVVRDGMTLMLAFPPAQKTIITKDKLPVLGNIPGVGRLFRSRSSQTQTNILFVLVTPTIVDPAPKRPDTSATNKDGDGESFVTPTNLRPIIDYYEPPR